MLQKLVSGRNLLDAGWRPAEQDVRIASEVLALLVYLQQQQQVTLYDFVESVSLHCHMILHLQICYVHVSQKLDTSLLFRLIRLPRSHVARHTVCLLCDQKLKRQASVV